MEQKKEVSVVTKNGRKYRFLSHSDGLDGLVNEAERLGNSVFITIRDGHGFREYLNVNEIVKVNVAWMD